MTEITTYKTKDISTKDDKVNAKVTSILVGENSFNVYVSDYKIEMMKEIKKAVERALSKRIVVKKLKSAWFMEYDEEVGLCFPYKLKRFQEPLEDKKYIAGLMGWDGTEFIDTTMKRICWNDDCEECVEFPKYFYHTQLCPKCEALEKKGLLGRDPDEEDDPWPEWDDPSIFLDRDDK